MAAVGEDLDFRCDGRVSGENVQFEYDWRIIVLERIVSAVRT